MTDESKTSPTSTAPATPLGLPVVRERCYGCFRPLNLCYCDEIPSIKNKTHVLILQHRREKFHPFNTARTVHRALQNSELVVDRVAKLASEELPIRPGAALLFPGKNAKLISELSPEERPEQIVIIDGTWHHAKQMMREIKVLHSLPQIRLAPTSPGNFRIRREPNETALATVEATVAALKELEPETQDLDQLIVAFDRMVDDQLAHPRTIFTRRRNTKRFGTPLNIPIAVIRDLENMLMVYGESSGGERVNPADSTPRKPIYWVAMRMGTGETFQQAIKYPAGLSETSADGIPDEKVLKYLELDAADFADAVSPEEFLKRWNEFARPTDHLSVYHPSTKELLRKMGVDVRRSLTLKSVDLGLKGTLATVLEQLGLPVPTPVLKGRAGQRLANAVSHAEHLHEFGNREPEDDD